MFHLQKVIRPVFNDMRDRMPVRWPRSERLQNQKVKRPLQEVALGMRFAFRHNR